MGPSRLGITWTRASSASAVEAATVRVNDAFTSGGQQIAGVRRQVGANLSSDLDYVRGIHSLRAGGGFELLQFDSDLTNNYLGTYTFDSLADYHQAAVYVQDDIRVTRALMLSPGLRYEMQSHVASAGNLGPRFGMTWSPFRSARTSLRGSVGVFYDWLNTTTIEQAARVDGFHQQEVNLVTRPIPIRGPRRSPLPSAASCSTIASAFPGTRGSAAALITRSVRASASARCMRMSAALGWSVVATSMRRSARSGRIRRSGI